jgi:nucleoside-diphosphate-sugar epimerase
MAKYFVTGANGYLASKLIESLLDKGHEVVGCIRSIKSECKVQSRFNNYTAILSSLPVQEIAESMKGSLAVLHLAASYSRTEHPDDTVLKELVDNNFSLGLKVLEAMVLSHTLNIISTGTYWQRAKENVSSPIDIYSSLKESFFALLRCYHHMYQIKALNLLLHDIYGPNDPRNKIFQILVNKAKDGTKIKMTSGNQVIYPLYIDDVIDAIYHAVSLLENPLIKSSMPPQTYTVFGPNGLSLKKVVNVLNNALNTTIDVRWGALDDNKRQILFPDISSPLPNWHAKTSLSKGIVNL